MAKPARVLAKPRTPAAVAGSAGGGLDRCLPPTPRAMTNVISTGTHDTFSYLTDIRIHKERVSYAYQFKTSYPQNDTSSEMIAMTTMPTLYLMKHQML